MRDERRRMGLNQADFARLGGVGVNSQNRYEAAATEPSALYFAELAANRVDVLAILAGRRSVDTLAGSDADLLDLVSSLNEMDRAALLTLAASLSGRERENGRPVPSRSVIEEAFRTFRSATPTDDPDELLHELAMQLPSILRGAGLRQPISETAEYDAPFSPREADDDDRLASQQGRHT